VQIRRRKTRKGAGDDHASGSQNSLFGEILDWMLAPLLFLWPISIIATHHVANSIANQPYDQSLAENVRTLGRLITVREDKVHIDFPAPARLLLRADEEDTIYFQVRSPHGEIVAGDADLPQVALDASGPVDQVLFRDDEIAGDDVRIAFMQFHAGNPPSAGLFVVQVAETRVKRSNLASRVVAGVLLPQFAIIPMAVILVYFGLGRGISPLNRLQRLIKRRRPSDLSPIGTTDLPEEVRPVIVAFNDMMERLEQNLHAQQRFIGDAAHQMRTPLTGLKMQTELALNESDPAQVRESLKGIARSTDRAAHLINQLLALARAEASFEKLYAVELIDLAALLRDMAEDFVPRALGRQIDFGLELADDQLLIEGNPLMLREMFSNLIDNAIKYTPVGGKITVRTRASEFAIVEVEDNGPGIPESERDLVFERFYRILGTGADGSGLGLPIVREIADIHRANVVLRAPQQGPGTLAVVTFPRRRAKPAGEAIVPDAFPLA
jgi:two-component system sensor histidine kinase TctE